MGVRYAAVVAIVLVTSGAVSGSPVTVSGHGSFAYDGLDGSTDLNFSGSDGIHSVFVSSDQFACCGPTFGESPYPPFGAAGVDELVYLPGNPNHTFRFALGESGFVALYDHGSQVAFQPIVGYVVMTSFVDPGCCGFYPRSGTFDIVPSPEPTALGLLGGGLAVIAAWRWVFGSRKNGRWTRK